MNILITGATSFIGVAVIKRLLEEEGVNIYAIIRPNSLNKCKLPTNPCVNVIELDMKEISVISQILKRNIDVFFHFAWEGVRVPLRDDYHIQQSNLKNTVEAVQCCKKLNCHKFIVSGSQAEYGNIEGEILETIECEPDTEYGKAKYEACKRVVAYAEKNNIMCIWGRIFSIYGLGDYKDSLIMSCLRRMKKNESIDLTECVQLWDYLFIDDLAEIFARFCYSDCLGGIYNIASGYSRPLKEFVEIMRNITTTQSEIHYGAISYPKNGMVSIQANVQKLKMALAWEPQVTFEEGIQKILRG